MITELEQHISSYRQWREQLAGAIEGYRDWLGVIGDENAVQDLRLYDMMETLKNDRLVIAFIAEFARGKTETINALFFSDYKSRLLPCDAGRTTMCPTEIFCDPNEDPYIKLLPIETRKRDDRLSVLKKSPDEWTKLRLDTSSAATMQEALHALVQQKEVTPEEARTLGLWNEHDIEQQHALKANGKVDIPTWRHALVNFTHPLLKSGLVVLDTPGLNTMGAEPELTISIIPNAHVVIFLMATDTGVTKSDMEIWANYIQPRATRKLAILNKVDILWDELKQDSEVQAIIQSQVTATARQLSLPPADVFAISAQKALLAKVREDPALLKQSGIERLEQALAQQVVATKHEILRNTVISEASDMVKESRKTIQARVLAARAHMQELESLRGKNRDVVQNLLSRVATDRKLYEESVRTFNQGSQKIVKKGEALMELLSTEQLDEMLENSRAKIGDTWTTRGLNQGMKSLIAETAALAERITQQGMEIKGAAEQLYLLFHTKHGFEMRKPPVLDMNKYYQSMLALQKSTEEFCSDPLNIMTEKHFLIRKFFLGLGGQVQEVFQQARKESRLWLRGLLSPLKLQITDHKTQLDKRTESLMNIHQDMESLQQNISAAEQQCAEVQGQSAALDHILLILMKGTQRDLDQALHAAGQAASNQSAASLAA